jgi:UDP-N-acetylglucosamine 1-carboxyvinyltransferase
MKFSKDTIEAQASELNGTYIFLDYPSSTATEILMIAACAAKGTTIIDNAETKPEIIDLAQYLQKCGVKISGAGTSMIKIKGTQKITGSSHSVIPDYLEAGTYMMAASITGGNLLVKNAIPNHLRPITAKLRETGAKISKYKTGLIVNAEGRSKAINFVATKPFPGLYSDLQPLLVSVLTKAEGISTVKDLVFEKRFCYATELVKMGANITIQETGVKICGVEKLKGVHVAATDIRGGAALILAGLAAEGETRVEGSQHVERAYLKIEEKLSKIGAKIRKG